MEKYNYDREGWKELEGMLWVQLKKFARVTLCTIAMVLVWIAAQRIGCLPGHATSGF